jgi:hypothetical protein
MLIESQSKWKNDNQIRDKKESLGLGLPHDEKNSLSLWYTILVYYTFCWPFFSPIVHTFPKSSIP